jgi:hypothetical protein
MSIDFSEIRPYQASGKYIQLVVRNLPQALLS